MTIPDWKIKQELYHRLTTEHPDVIGDDLILDMTPDEIKYTCVKMSDGREHRSLWPAKSYLVGYLYSVWLSEEYGGSYKEYLKDPDLLYGNDPFFKPYDGRDTTVSSIYIYLDMFASTSWKSPVNKDIRKYFELEMV